ncbi:hypothetical protein FRC12_020981 [Ceratobasidium sp. 428]|nr:hypothetical protein FRC12_020981 [Ceratobasidium sp. 428]
MSPPHKRSASDGAGGLLQSLDSATLAVRSRTQLEAALRKHGKEVQVAVAAGARTCFVQFFAVPKVPYDLLSCGETSQPLSHLIQDFTQLNSGTISYNTSDPTTILGTGQFKHCFLGKITLENPPWPDTATRSLQVALKRPFTTHSTNPNGTARFPPAVELNNIITEASVSQWGATLLDEVYSFINTVQQASQETDEHPPVPLLRFVHIGIAKCIGPGQKTVQSLQGAFLVEEEIPRSYSFVRFLGNASAIPCEFPPDSASNNIAQFCAFAQHVQWVITGGQIYCADWQGGIDPSTGNALLTDPQLITNPDLGMLFADGNVPETYSAFPKEHCCETNGFCMYFKPGAIILPEKDPKDLTEET